MNAFRCVLSVFAAVAILATCVLSAGDLSGMIVLTPVAIVGGLYGLLHLAELLFAAAVHVKLKAHLREQHLRREQVRSQRLKKARR